MKTKLISMFFILLLATSCGTIDHHGKPKYNYPYDIKQICENAKNDAVACIESQGTKVNLSADCSVVKKNGEKKINGYWSWRSPEWQGMWVCGLTARDGGGYKIIIGCNPSNGLEISPAALKHENGHYILMSMKGDYSHDPKYQSCFFNWKEPRGIRSVIKEINGQKVIFDLISDEDVVST